MSKNTDATDPQLSKETGKLDNQILQKIHYKLLEDAVQPDEDGCYEFFVSLTRWEYLISFFSPRLALKLCANRNIRERNKDQE